MGIEKQHESAKITGDKFQPALDRAVLGGPGRRGEGEPDEEGEEVELEERDDPEAEDAEDE
jgi:hypothetical protein